MIGVLESRGFAAGYPLSFVFWYELCEEHGAGLPAIFVERLGSEERRTTDAAVRLIEEIAGCHGILARLTKADVNHAIELLESLSAR